VKKLILLALLAVLCLAAVAPLGPARADDAEKVSRLTTEEIGYWHRLEQAYKAAYGVLDPLETSLLGAGIGTLLGAQVDTAALMGQLVSAASVLRGQAAAFREPPPASMQGLGGINGLAASKLETSFAPCIGILAEAGKNKFVEWGRDLFGLPPAENQPSVKAKLFACITGEVGAIKETLQAGQAAL